MCIDSDHKRWCVNDHTRLGLPSLDRGALWVWGGHNDENTTSATVDGVDITEAGPEDFSKALAQLVARYVVEEMGESVDSGLLERRGIESITVSCAMTPMEYIAVARAVADVVKNIPRSRVGAYRGEGGPVWGILETATETLSYPAGMAVHLLRGEIGDYEAVLLMADDTESGFAEGCTLKIVIPPESAGKAREWIKNLREVAARDYDPIRGKIVEIAAVGGDVRPRIIETPRGSLSDVVVEDRILAELGRNILDHISSIDALKKAGLGSNRGVLLWGPPGTGKTSLVRGLINQLEGKATILIPNSHAIADALNLVYDDAVRLAPSVVVLEDIDVVAGKRSRQNSNLAGFLASLDGVISDPGAMVVTIATTNDPAGIDDAATRPGRIDKFLEVPLPDQSLREKILRQYLTKLQEGDLTVEVGNGAVNALARNSEGASGAMLREVVRRALLIAHCSNGNKLDDACLAAGAEEIGYSSVQTGQYL